jgi:hypothetical protein
MRLTTKKEKNMTQTATRGKIYVSSPMTAYTLPLYDENLKLIRERWCTAEIVPARGHYDSNGDWLKKWEAEKGGYSGCVFFSHQGVVGKGTVKEVADLDALNVPILYLRSDGTFVLYAKVKFKLLDGGMSWTRYAVVVEK